MRIPRPHLSRRATAVTALLVVAAVVAAIVVIDSSSGPSDPSSVGSTATGAATVARRDLIETDTESGTLGYANSYTVYNWLSGTITWLPAVGQIIQPGHRLFSIDGFPVILLDGTHPAYRELTAADASGVDILQLNANLVDLGYDPEDIVVDDKWQDATTTGVEALQKAFSEPETGSLALGDVAFMPGAQMVSSLDGAVGSTGGGGADASDIDPPAATEFVGFDRDSDTGTATTPDTTTIPTTTTTTTAPSGDASLAQEVKKLEQEIAKLKASSSTQEISQLRAEVAQLQASDAGGTDDSKPDAGDDSGDTPTSSGTATAIVQTTSTQLVVTVDLDASLQSEAAVGEKVTVEMPDGSTVGGHVTSVSPVASSSSDDDDSGDGSGDSGSGSSTVPVIVTLDKRATGAGLDQASVSVNFTKAKAHHVLTVPVTALLATGGDSFAVQEATAPHKLVPVTTGIFAAGYVQISGTGIYPGLQVTDSQG